MALSYPRSIAASGHALVTAGGGSDGKSLRSMMLANLLREEHGSSLPGESQASAGDRSQASRVGGIGMQECGAGMKARADGSILNATSA